MPLFIHCPDCQHKNPAEAEHCDVCGGSLPDTVTNQASERHEIQEFRDKLVTAKKRLAATRGDGGADAA